jgi:hypothetical protein
MGASVEIECPMESCSYRAMFRLAMGEETNGRAVRAAILRDEHPDHPPDAESDQSGMQVVSN